jgi:carbamate kinase
MRILIALGGNALLRRGQQPDAENQHANIRAAARAIASVARDHEVIITHGNGPQVGLLALESAADPALTRPYPLDVLGAETQGMIGYLLGQALRNALPADREVATIVTETLVSGADPAFRAPTKFVGPVYTQDEAEALAADRGYAFAQDGPHWRRVVASPEPQSFIQARTIRKMVTDGTLVICAGGGGSPVVRDEDTGRLQGVEAVVDKDLTAALLAELLEADMLVLLTDVPCVQRGYGTGHAENIRHATPDELAAEQFPAGSMGPKIEAACRFVEMTGRIAAIGALDQAHDIVRGQAGTQIRPRAATCEPHPAHATTAHPALAASGT